MKKFESLLRSEVSKAEKAANEFYGCQNAKVTGYSYKEVSDPLLKDCWYEVKCEICFDYEERADHDVLVNVYMPDRRRSFAKVKTW